jgi:hypothetical protein
MGSELDTVVAEVSVDMRTSFDEVRTQHGELLAQLSDEIDGACFENFQDDAFDMWDETCDHFTAKASNRLENADDQTAAMAMIESVVSSTISRDSSHDLALIAVWAYGPEQAVDRIRVMIGTGPTL